VTFLPVVILVLLFGGLVLLNRRGKTRTDTQTAQRTSRLRLGTDVMTTSGLYATVVSVDMEEQTAMLSIAPGVEVKWTIAALREVDEVPKEYREPLGEVPDDPDTDASN
jgi:preprotein translocase subunit YajC